MDGNGIGGQNLIRIHGVQGIIDIRERKFRDENITVCVEPAVIQPVAVIVSDFALRPGDVGNEGIARYLIYCAVKGVVGNIIAEFRNHKNIKAQIFKGLGHADAVFLIFNEFGPHFLIKIPAEEICLNAEYLFQLVAVMHIVDKEKESSSSQGSSPGLLSSA